MEIYNVVRTVPENAKKPIYAGRLKGMTDINPMWRIQALTEQFGPVGIGWYYKTVRKWVEEGADGVKCAFVDIELYIKHNNEWSMPIEGTGGNSFVAKEKSGLYTSDEAFKMALTDAISVACKALGFGADVYWQAGRSKYNPTPTGNGTQSKAPSQEVYISETQIKKIQNILRVFPKANRETTLNILLNEFGAKELTELPQGKYVLFFNRLVDSANVVIKKSLQGFVKNFASRAGKTEEEIRELLKTALGKDIDEVELAEYPQYAKNAKQMAEDYKVENNEQTDIQ
jgi:hypothetical protein